MQINLARGNFSSNLVLMKLTPGTSLSSNPGTSLSIASSSLTSTHGKKTPEESMDASDHDHSDLVRPLPPYSFASV